MHETSLAATGGWGTLVAVVGAVVLLALVLFVGGKPSDIDRGRWRLWLFGGLAMVAVLFLLARATSNLPYQSCYASGRC